MLGSETCTSDILNHFFTNGLGNKKIMVNVFISTYVIYFFRWNKTLDPMKINYTDLQTVIWSLLFCFINDPNNCPIIQLSCTALQRGHFSQDSSHTLMACQLIGPCYRACCTWVFMLYKINIPRLGMVSSAT